jgi:predicted phage terminase large subunit-like protein
MNLHLHPTINFTSAELWALEREAANRSLAEFAKQSWHVLEPATPLKWGWVLDAICEHLEAISNGEIQNLLATVPPGTMKSLLTSVIWPAWEWGPKNLQEKRFLSTAHSLNLAIRDTVKSRRLIKSKWYQERWPVELEADQDTKSKFENSRTGFREASAFTKMTGVRGDRVILDDPISAFDADSDAELYNARIAFTETLPTRINNDKSSIAVIMQRLNKADVAGIILEKELDFVHLMVPMEFEVDRKCHTAIGWSDPRTEEGELMFPERFPRTQVETLKAQMGAYATAGQLQQRPSPRGGGIFKVDVLKKHIIQEKPEGYVWVRAWDLAATEADQKDITQAWTRGCLIGKQLGVKKPRYCIAHMTGVRGEPNVVDKLISDTAEKDGKKVYGDLPQDPGQAGKAQVAGLIAGLSGYVYSASPESGSKLTRAQPLAAQVNIGNVDIVEGTWNEAFFEELEVFPASNLKDQVDAASRGFAWLLECSTYTLENI